MSSSVHPAGISAVWIQQLLVCCSSLALLMPEFSYRPGTHLEFRHINTINLKTKNKNCAVDSKGFGGNAKKCGVRVSGNLRRERRRKTFVYLKLDGNTVDLFVTQEK